jgi:hypothetical protein
VPVPTETPSNEQVEIDLHNESINSTFSWAKDDGFGPQGPIIVGCKRCVTQGQLLLTQGQIDLSSIGELTEQIIDADKELDFIKSGFFQLELNGFSSSNLLRAIPSGSVAFSYDLFSVPIVGFKVS